MKNMPLPHVFSAVAVSAAFALTTSSALAGTVLIEPVNHSSQPFQLPTARRFPSPNSDIFCSYSPDDVTADSLGDRALITLVELQGNSTFRYERLLPTTTPLRVSVNDTVSRTLTFTNTSANQAGRRLINRPDEYASLLGLSPSDPIVRAGFSAIAPQFTCGLYNETLTAAAQFPNGQTSRQETPIAALPDGNYRLTSDPYADNDSPDTAVTQFLFRKLGDTITGNLEYLGNDGPKACISGTLEGNTVVGEASTNSTTNRVLGRNYLGDRLDLQLGDTANLNRYSDATLDLSGFTRINAGTVAPPAVCG
ncbi:MAG: hypothetical protein ACFB16_14230 [Phormidesmis sp.]